MAEEILHAKLSPSSSGRWMHCAGSIAVNSGPSRTTSFYAEEGTAAHHLLDTCLTASVDPDRFLGTFIYKDFEVTDEMCEAVGLALDWINAYLSKNPNATLHTEKGVDPFSLLKCQKDYASGTLDVALDNAPAELVIMDYKHGAGVVVEVEGNTQTLQYALGYVSQYATQPYKQYRLVIIQPRARHEEGPVREIVLTHEEVMAHADVVKKRIREIAKRPDDREAGKWCTFCAGAGKCKTLAEHSLKIAAMEFGALEQEPVNPDELDPEELSYAILHLPILEKWMKAVYAAALDALMNGVELPDLKLVHGRSSRKWIDEAKALNILSRNFDLDEIAPRALLGIANVQRVIKRHIALKIDKRAERKVKFESAMKKLSLLIQNSKPALHVAPETDPRPAVKRGEEFETVPMAERVIPKRKVAKKK